MHFWLCVCEGVVVSKAVRAAMSRGSSGTARGGHKWRKRRSAEQATAAANRGRVLLLLRVYSLSSTRARLPACAAEATHCQSARGRWSVVRSPRQTRFLALKGTGYRHRPDILAPFRSL